MGGQIDGWVATGYVDGWMAKYRDVRINRCMGG